MKNLVCLIAVVVALVCASVASACPVATVSAFSAPVVVQSHCAQAVAVQAVQPVAVQAFAIPTVSVLQAPVVVQQVHVKQQRQRVFQRSVVRTRTVVR